MLVRSAHIKNNCNSLIELLTNFQVHLFVCFSDSNKKIMKNPTRNIIIAVKVKLLCLWLKLQNICTDKTNIQFYLYGTNADAVLVLMQTQCWSLNVPAE